MGEAMRFRRLYRCSYVDGHITKLTAALDDDYADCTANLYKVIATDIDHPLVNVVIHCSKGPNERFLAAYFEPGDIRVLLHSEAVVGRSLVDAQADPLLDWSGVAAEVDDEGIIVKLIKISTTAH
jgi:hypothetical protein